MKDQDIIKAIAELDGWLRNTALDYVCLTCPGNETVKRIMWSKGQKSCCEDDFERYLTSRDAIIPVIEKQPRNIKQSFIAYLWDTLSGDDVPNIRYCEAICATPRQLCEALLRANGKWID